MSLGYTLNQNTEEEEQGAGSSMKPLDPSLWRIQEYESRPDEGFPGGHAPCRRIHPVVIPSDLPIQIRPYPGEGGTVVLDDDWRFLG